MIKTFSVLSFSVICALLSLQGIGYAQTHFTAVVDVDQEIPAPEIPEGLNPTGTGSFTLNDDQTELTFHITVTDLSGPMTAGHFHMASAGVAGGVVRGFSADEVSGNTISGVWSSADAAPLLVAELLAGDIYVNIHTSDNPPGEIRGQVLATTGIGFTAIVDVDQAVPAPAIPEGLNPTGTGSFTLNDDETELTFRITVTDLSGPITAAHFHMAPAGVAGGVVRGFSAGEISGNTISGVWSSTDAAPLLVDELLAGDIYVNIHTGDNPPGEIRGQVLATTPIEDTAVEPSTWGKIKDSIE